MDDTAQQAERDKVVLELYRASFLHVAKCIKDDLVLSDIQPKFPDLADLEDEWEQSLSKDKKYIDFKKERDDLMIRWGQHIEQAKRANTKVHECEEILDRIWKIRKEYKLYHKSSDTQTEEEQKKNFKYHLKVLIKLEQLLKSSNLEHGDKKKQKSQIGAGHTQPATNEDIKETGQSDERNVLSTDDDDDIQTTNSSKPRQSKIKDEGSSQKAETESIDSGLDDTKSSKLFNDRKEELESDQPMDTSDIKDFEVVKMDTDDTHSKENSKRLEDFEQLQIENEKLKTEHKEKKNDLKTIKKNLAIRNKEVADMINAIEELKKRNQDLENQIKRFPSKGTESRLKEANDTIQALKDENDRIQEKYKSFKDLEDQLNDFNGLIQSLTEENERISKVLELPAEKTKKMVTSLQKKLDEEVKQKENLSEICDKYKAAYKKQQKTNKTQEERLANMQRPQTAPSRQYREMQTMVETLKDEKESLMQRLSKVAGMKMKDNNPAIADLSDPNRPEKLSEKFREIYDNAWTNLLDDITEKTGESDDICVKQIVNALMMMYDTSKNTITSNKREMAKLLGYPEDCFDKPYAGGKEGHDPVLKTLKDLIQVSVTRQSVAITKNIKEFPEIKTILKVGGKNGDAFITECLQLCFYMCTQDPPVVLDFSCKSGDAFNKDKFTPFTKSGSIVDYVVWPVMYLSDNGAIMSKGIAQGK